MKIALAQLNPVIGDFDKNGEKICQYSQKAADAGCDLVIFPELALSGYPPQQLLAYPAFLEAQKTALTRICKNLPSIDILLGCFESSEDGQEEFLYNSAVVIRNGEIVFRSGKRIFSQSEIFDESRYFQPVDKISLYNTGSQTFAVIVGEEELVQEASVSSLLAKARARKKILSGIICVAASAFHYQKSVARRGFLAEVARKHKLPLYYCNQIGGQDALIFDGGSLAFTSDGQLACQACRFAEDLVIVDSVSGKGEVRRCEFENPVALIHDALVLGLRDYVVKSGFSEVVLGLSGGIDSALVAALAVTALGADKVLGVALPSPYSSKKSLEDARQLAGNLGCRFEVLPIDELFHAFKADLRQFFTGRAEDVTEQNLQARIRGNLLMALSNKFGSMLLTTGNKSELAVGYCTLYGDMSGGLAVIADLPKGLVYTVSEYINRDGERIPESILTKAPSAELKPDQKDQDELPPYPVLDEIIALFFEEKCGLEDIVARGFPRDMVTDVLRRIRINEYKRQQAPLGLKVTSTTSAGRGFFPVVHNFRG